MNKKIDLKSIILKELSKKKEIRTSQLIKKTGFSKSYIHRNLQELVKKHDIILLGKANQSRYVLSDAESINRSFLEKSKFNKFLINVNISEDKILAEIKNNTSIYTDIPVNVANILDYAFTEMLNNAIEHSQSNRIQVNMRKENDLLFFNVVDKGIGIFNNLMQKRNLKNEFEAIQDILKGKQTTAPDSHSGEGIFFTSKVLDRLTIKGSSKKIIYDNIVGDIFIRDNKPIIGTKVEGVISISSKNLLSDIFRKYTVNEFEFDKTIVRVSIYKIGQIQISRSQARRILAGLDTFKTIVLDFNEVDTIGQAFADEVFRVFQRNHPDIKIEYSNANENVEFMIKHIIQNP
jgi:anti-sigma regulatory factor (Ser/Thr protein kinase)